MFKKSLADSFLFFKNHLLAIAIIVLPIVIPVDIFTAFYQYFLAGEAFGVPDQILPMLVGMIAYPIYSVGVIFYIASIISGERLNTKALWRLGVKFWAPYLILTILVGLAVAFGFLLLVIPGIIFAIRYAFAEFHLLLNNDKPTEAMKNSWGGTKEYMWVILGGYVVISIVLYVPYILLTAFLAETNISFWLPEMVLSTAYSVLSVLYTIFAFRVYEFAKSQHNHSLNEDAP